MDQITTNFRGKKEKMRTLINISQNLDDLNANLSDGVKEDIDYCQNPSGPKLQSNQIQSKDGDSGDLFDSGSLFETADKNKPIRQQSFKFTSSGTLMINYCSHVILYPDVEQKLFEQIKKNAYIFEGICKDPKCRLKYSHSLTNVQKLLLFQLHENQANKLKEDFQKKVQIYECTALGCNYYFVINKNYKQQEYFCPLCFEKFPIQI